MYDMREGPAKVLSPVSVRVALRWMDVRQIQRDASLCVRMYVTTESQSFVRHAMRHATAVCIESRPESELAGTYSALCSSQGLVCKYIIYTSIPISELDERCATLRSPLTLPAAHANAMLVYLPVSL